MRSEKRNGKAEICTVLHCSNPAVSDGYCDAHLERLELIKESYENMRQMHLRTREDEKGVALERPEEASPRFDRTKGLID